MKKGWLNFCRQGMEGFFNGITDKKYVVDKSRGWGIYYDFLNTFYPNPKIVCMIRDLSLLSVYPTFWHISIFATTNIIIWQHLAEIK